MLLLFYLSNVSFHCKEINLIYSIKFSGTSFNRLSYSIEGYEGPTIIIIKHKNEKNEYIFGGFNSEKWI